MDMQIKPLTTQQVTLPTEYLLIYVDTLKIEHICVTTRNNLTWLDFTGFRFGTFTLLNYK